MSQRDPNNFLREFCDLTGRKICTKAEFSSLSNVLLRKYLQPIGVDIDAPPIVVTDDNVHFAGYLHGDWQGILIDQKYLWGIHSFIIALLEGENCVDLALPFIRVIAHEWEVSGRGVEALALRHERLSGLYAIEEACMGIKRLLECDEFFDSVDLLKKRSHSAFLGMAFCYVGLHEIGHWLYNGFSHDRALGRNREEILGYVKRVLSVEIPEPLKNAANQIPEQLQNFKSIDPESLAEEVFCDRLVSGLFYLRSAREGGEWTETFALLRIMQEAKRLLNRALMLANDQEVERRFLENVPELENALVSRWLDSMHVRASLVNMGLPSHIIEIYAEYGDGNILDMEEVRNNVEKLLSQSLVAFTQLAGPGLERCVFLMWRSLVVKLSDTEIRCFFEGLVRRYNITKDKDQRKAFERIVTQVSDGLFDG